MESMDKRIGDNTENINRTRKEVGKMDTELRKVERRMDDMQEKLEETIFEEIRERDQRKLNLVIHGLEEPSDEIEDTRERAEEDKEACGLIFKTIKARATKSSLRFCRRIGKRGRDPRPVVVGMFSEEERRNVLEKARELQHTKYKNVNIVPDLTKKQRAEEARMKDEAERRNRDLTEEDREKNVKWLVIGKRGERRMIKGQEREITSRGDRNGRAGAIERNQGEQDERADRPTGTRKKEGGAWTANSRERNYREARDGHWYRKEWSDRRMNYRDQEQRERRYQRNEISARRMSRGRGETSVMEIGREERRERIDSKRGRESTDSSDREEDWPKPKSYRL
jgi:hypothetical protein